MDIKLSKRMQAVADMVDGGNVVDIGCDHAFVSIYLAGKPFVKKVIAMDVKTGPVDIAKANVAAYNLEDKIEIRMSDGFEKLEVGEADVAVIAGMGGYLMIEILEKGKPHLNGGIGLVLQPQSDIKAVREYLVNVGYTIENEDMLIEEGKYYSIIKAIPDSGNKADYSVEDYTYGPILLKKKHKTLKEYLYFSKEKNLQLEKKLTEQGSQKSKERVQELLEERKYIDNILQIFFEESI